MVNACDSLLSRLQTAEAEPEQEANPLLYGTSRASVAFRELLPQCNHQGPDPHAPRNCVLLKGRPHTRQPVTLPHKCTQAQNG